MRWETSERIGGIPRIKIHPDDWAEYRAQRTALEEAGLAEMKRPEGEQFKDVTIPHVELPVSFGDTVVTMQGHAHFEANADAEREPIVDIVASSDVIVSESAVRFDKNEIAKKHRGFFKAIVESAWKHKVPAVGVDPHLHQDVRQGDLERRLSAIKLVEWNVFAVALSSILASLGLTAQQSITGAITRRKFLIGTGSAAIASLLSYSSLKAFVGQRTDASRTDEGGNMFALSEMDFRDVCSSYATLLLVKNLPQGSNIGWIYGADHVKPALFYMQNPFELAIRMALYQSILFRGLTPKFVVHIPPGAPPNPPDAKDWLDIPIDALGERR